MKRKSKNGEVPNTPVKSNKRGHAGVASVSLIIFLLDKFSDWVYNSLIEGFFGRIFGLFSGLLCFIFFARCYWGRLKVLLAHIQRIPPAPTLLRQVLLILPRRAPIPAPQRLRRPLKLRPLSPHMRLVLIQ